MSGKSDLAILAKPMSCSSAREITASDNGTSQREPSYFDRRPWRATQQVSPRTQDDMQGLGQVEDRLTMGDDSLYVIQIQGYAQNDGNTVDRSSYLTSAMTSTTNARSSETSPRAAAPFLENENPHLRSSASTTLSPTSTAVRFGNVTNISSDDWPDELPAFPPSIPRSHSNSNIVLSLRGGGDDSSDNDWPQPKRKRPENSRCHGLFSKLTSTHNTTITTQQQKGDITMDESHTLEPVPATSNPTTSINAQFSTDFPSFEALPLYLQLYTRDYLQGEATSDWIADLDLPLMDMFLRLRFCALLLCEAENAALRCVTRLPECYALFRDGLSANCLAGDDDAFVRTVRRDNPALDRRMQNPHERMRILWAFQTVDFPALMAGESEVDVDANVDTDTDADEGSLYDKEDGDRERDREMT